MGLIAMVGPDHPLQSTCGAALRMLGHRVECLDPGSVFEAMAWLTHHLPDAVMVDLDMSGGCTGESLLRAISEDPEMEHLPRLALTCSQDPVFLERIQRYGLRSLLLDPRGSDPVVEAVALALKTSRPCVAVVDPNPRLRGMLLANLRAAECLPLELEPLSVFGLLRALRRVRPDALVCPEHLPSFAVMSLLRALREDPELRGLSVLITADQPAEAVKDLVRFGNLECLPRPVPAEALREWVGRVL